MEIFFEVKNSTGVITLNRPKALNALNINMAIQLSEKLKEWEGDNRVERVILLGEGNHFCAGGDVKSVHLSGPFSALKREFFFKQKTAYDIGVRLVGSEMCIRDSLQHLQILV